MPRLSHRTSWPLEPTPLQRALQQARAQNRDLVDLTVTNPTEVGLVHPAEVYALLGDAGSRTYRPEPFGLRTAREAVADFYARRDVDVDPDQVWLCGSTSEAYGHLFALLCDPGETVLGPRPGYPLLGHLADIASIRLASYASSYDGRWWLDVEDLRASAQHDRPRGIIAVVPGNPTGSALCLTERSAMQDVAARSGAALVVDEVFADYPLDAAQVSRFVPTRVASFVLSGLSKVACLPQLKLAWVIMRAPDRATLERTRARAEVVADAYLSPGTPVQLALPSILRAAEPMQQVVRARIAGNLERLDAAVHGTPLSRLHADAGWAAVLRLPALDLDDEGWSLLLVREAGLVVQPGYLYDLPGPPHVAVSLLSHPATFSRGIERLVALVSARCG